MSRAAPPASLAAVLLLTCGAGCTTAPGPVPERTASTLDAQAAAQCAAWLVEHAHGRAALAEGAQVRTLPLVAILGEDETAAPFAFEAGYTLDFEPAAAEHDVVTGRVRCRGTFTLDQPATAPTQRLQHVEQLVALELEPSPEPRAVRFSAIELTAREEYPDPREPGLAAGYQASRRLARCQPARTGDGVDLSICELEEQWKGDPIWEVDGARLAALTLDGHLIDAAEIFVNPDGTMMEIPDVTRLESVEVVDLGLGVPVVRIEGLTNVGAAAYSGCSIAVELERWVHFTALRKGRLVRVFATTLIEEHRQGGVDEWDDSGTPCEETHDVESWILELVPRDGTHHEIHRVLVHAEGDAVYEDQPVGSREVYSFSRDGWYDRVDEVE